MQYGQPQGYAQPGYAQPGYAQPMAAGYDQVGQFAPQGGFAPQYGGQPQQAAYGLPQQPQFTQQQPQMGGYAQPQQGGFDQPQQAGFAGAGGGMTQPPTATQPGQTPLDDHDKWHADMMDKFNDLHARADKLHKAYGLDPVGNLKKELSKLNTGVQETTEFIKGLHKGTVNGDNIQEKAPKWVYSEGENSCLSGICMELPCIDPYAPNVSGCCCCHPWYSERVYDFDEFFSEITPQLHTGDIILCSWVNEDIAPSRFLMHSKWSHVGVIYRPSDCPDVLTSPSNPDYQSRDKSRPLIAQMINNGEGLKGFEIDDFEYYMKDYLDKHSQLACRQPPPDPSKFGEFQISVRFLDGVDRNRAFYQAIQNCVEKNKEMKYGMSPLSGIDLCQSNPCCAFLCAKYEDAVDDPDVMMCAEFVATVYQELGLINPALNPNEFIPPMFDTSRHLWLRKGAYLSMQHSLSGPATLEERKKMGYKSQPGQAASVGNGFWGTDTTVPVPILEHGQVQKDGSQYSNTKKQMAPAQNSMQQPLLNR